jgi:hypothetical protein
VSLDFVPGLGSSECSSGPFITVCIQSGSARRIPLFEIDMSPSYEAAAQEILVRVKSEKFEGPSLLPRTFMSRSKRTTSSYKGISAALLSVVQGNGRPGVD